MNRKNYQIYNGVRQGGLFIGVVRCLLVLALLPLFGLAACDPGFKVEEADFGSATTTTTTQVPKYLYAANKGSGTVTGYSIDLSTGELTALSGSPFTAQANLRDVKADPSGTHLYVTSETTNSISVFSIDQNTGDLTAITGSPFAIVTSPWGVRVHPNGNYVYVAEATIISRFVRDTSTGALSSKLTVGFGGTAGSRIVIDPSERFLYLADIGGGSAYSYSIDGTDGSLTPIEIVTTGPGASQDFAIDSSGTYLYLGNNNGASTVMEAYAINQSTGVLSALTPSVYTTGTGPSGVGFDSTGTWLYTANFFDSDITGFAFDGTDGSLTPLGGFPLTADINPYAVLGAASYVYIANFGAGTVSSYIVDGATGDLTETAQSPILSGANTIDLDIVYGDP